MRLLYTRLSFAQRKNPHCGVLMMLGYFNFAFRQYLRITKKESALKQRLMTNTERNSPQKPKDAMASHVHTRIRNTTQSTRRKIASKNARAARSELNKGVSFIACTISKTLSFIPRQKFRRSGCTRHLLPRNVFRYPK